MERSPHGQLGEILHPVFVSQLVPLFVFESVKPRLLCIYERLRLKGGWCFTSTIYDIQIYNTYMYSIYRVYDVSEYMYMSKNSKVEAERRLVLHQYNI